jgi:hypothetical protein
VSDSCPTCGRSNRLTWSYLSEATEQAAAVERTIVETEFELLVEQYVADLERVGVVFFSVGE